MRASVTNYWVPFTAAVILTLLASVANSGIVENGTVSNTAAGFSLPLNWDMDSKNPEAYSTPNNSKWQVALSSPVSTPNNKSLAISVRHSASSDNLPASPNPNAFAQVIGPLPQGDKAYRRKGFQIFDHPLTNQDPQRPSRKDADVVVWEVSVSPLGLSPAPISIEGGHASNIGDWNFWWEYRPIANTSIRVEEKMDDGTTTFYKGVVEYYPIATPSEKAGEVQPDQNGSFSVDPRFIYKRGKKEPASKLTEYKVVAGSSTTETTLAFLATTLNGLTETDLTTPTRFFFPSGPFLDVPDLTADNLALYIGVDLAQWAGHPLIDDVSSFLFDDRGKSEQLPGFVACLSEVVLSPAEGFLCPTDFGTGRYLAFSGSASLRGYIGGEASTISEPDTLILLITSLLALGLGKVRSHRKNNVCQAKRHFHTPN